MTEQTENVTQKAPSVTVERDTPRARTLSYGESVTMSRVTTQRDVTGTESDSDMVSRRPPHHHHEKPKSSVKAKASWAHIAALNLIADHQAGIPVEPAKLEIARRFVGAA